MALIFDEDSVEWLREKGFTAKEIADSERIISTALKSAEGEKTIKLPQGVSHKVAALVYSVLSTEETTSGEFITLTEEAREALNEEMEIGELETTISKIGGMKLTKRYSDPRRKSSIKKERSHPE
ncbi:MAG: hypothetical protein QXT45_01245 [Candidatus Bilamarchaeaceae archaeon]